jgi:hypothetical protein
VIDIDSRSTVSVLSGEEINRNLFRRRISADGKSIEQIEPDYNDPSSVVRELRRSLETDEQCNIKGRIKLTRVRLGIRMQSLGYRIVVVLLLKQTRLLAASLARSPRCSRKTLIGSHS